MALAVRRSCGTACRCVAPVEGPCTTRCPPRRAALHCQAHQPQLRLALWVRLAARSTSDALTSTHVSIAGLLSDGLVAASVTHWERQASPTPELPVPAEDPPHLAASGRQLRSSPTPGSSPQQRAQGLSKSVGGWGEQGNRSPPARGRYGLTTTPPVRASLGSPLVQQAAEPSPRRQEQHLPAPHTQQRPCRCQ